MLYVEGEVQSWLPFVKRERVVYPFIDGEPFLVPDTGDTAVNKSGLHGICK